ncbi:MAG: response regulator [Candidatus Lokiarchaeota archaeon]|nr:response regulator [Candidatus Lokiarchaeota archaeon]
MSDKNSILICDDEPDIVSLVQKFLQLDNYNTITCNNGKEALKVLEEKYEEIVLILLDVMMPGGFSGFEVLRTIKSKDSYKDIKVILFTVKSFKEDKEKGNELGADGYVTKPFSGNELRSYIKEILNN